MPPTKARKNIKKKREKRGGYTVEKIKEALVALDDGMSLRAASKRFGVPRTTLLYKRKGKTPLECKKGPETVLKEEQEIELVKWIQRFNKLGFVATKNQIFDSVQILLNDSQTKSKFTNNRPGRHWYESFLKRHPGLLENISKHSLTGETNNTENLLREWHVLLKEHLISKGLNKCESRQIFMIEEISFSFDVKEKNSIEKEYITALFAGNAKGEVLPPMVIFLNKDLPQTVQQNIPTDWLVYYCDKPNVTGDTFYKYVTDTFYSWLLKNNLTLPVVLYINGQKSHLSLPLCKFCDNHDIEIVPLNAKISNKLQPLEIGFFHYLRIQWNETLKEWHTDNEKQLDKENIVSFLKKSIVSLDVVNNLQNAFTKCGLYPLNYNSVDHQMILKYKISEKKVLHKHTKTSNQYDSKNLSHFTFFEQNIDPEILAAFQELEFIGKWVGDIKHESLFNVWLNMKKLVYNQQGSEETPNESDVDFLDSKEENVSDDELKSLSEVTPQIIEEPKNFIFDSINYMQNSSENLWT